MDIEDIEVVHTELLEGLSADLAAVLGAAVQEQVDLAVGDSPRDAELGCQRNVLATLGVLRQPLSDKDFTVPILLGGVPAGRAQLPGSVQNLEAFLIRSVVALAFTHKSEAGRRD